MRLNYLVVMALSGGIGVQKNLTSLLADAYDTYPFVDKFRLFPAIEQTLADLNRYSDVRFIGKFQVANGLV